MRAKIIARIVQGNRVRIAATSGLIQLADAGNEEIPRERGGPGLSERIRAGKGSDGADDKQFVRSWNHGRHRKCPRGGRC